MSVELFFIALIVVGVYQLAANFVQWIWGKEVAPQPTTVRGGYHSVGGGTTTTTKKKAVKKKPVTTTTTKIASPAAPRIATTPNSKKKKKTSLLDAPIFISPHNRPTRPRTREEEQTYIASLQKSAGASREEAAEYVRRLTAFEKSKGCY